MYQQITIVGHLGGDPVMRLTSTGVNVTSFSMGVNRNWTNADGSKGEKTTWFKVTTWRKLAEICATYLTKGQLVMVVGEMEPARAYTNNAGEAAATLELTAATVKFLSKSNGNGRPAAHNEEPVEDSDIAEDQVPF